VTTDVVDVVEAAPVVAGLSIEELAAELLARSDAMRLVGPGGSLSGLTKRVLESALEAEMTEHVGCAP
jgi:putative transposase